MGQAKIFNSFIAIDFEYLIIGDYTTACQIGMIKCVQREIIDEYIEIIRPPHTNGPLAPNNSIKIEQTETALTFIEQYDKIRDFMEDLPLVAHNKSTEINVANYTIYHLLHKEKNGLTPTLIIPMQDFLSVVTN